MALTAGGAVLVVHDGGQQNLLLTGGADVQDGAVGAVLCLQLVVHLFAQNAQILSGVQDLDLVVHDVQIAPVGGLAFDDQRIPAGELQLGAPDTAGVGAGDHAGQRGLGHDHVAAGGRGIGAGHGAGDVDELVFRGQGIDRGYTLIIEDLGAETAAADEFLRHFQIQRLDLDLAGGQVDAGYFFVVSVAHVNTSSKSDVLYHLNNFPLWVYYIVRSPGSQAFDRIFARTDMKRDIPDTDGKNMLCETVRFDMKLHITSASPSLVQVPQSRYNTES